MSNVEEFYKTAFSLGRMITVSGSETDAEQTIASGMGFLQPVQDKNQLMNVSDWGKEYWFFCKKDLSVVASFRSEIGRTTNPVTNDVMTIDGVKYGVNGVSEFGDPFEDTDAHLKIVVTRRTSSNFE